MTQIRVLVLFAAVILFCSTLQDAMAQSGGGIKNPYSMTVQAFRNGTSVDVRLLITSIDPQHYPLPNLMKEAVADPASKSKTSPKKYTVKNNPILDGQVSFVLLGLGGEQQFNLKVHVKADGWQDEHLESDVRIITRPDLAIANVTVPQVVYVSTPFDIQASISELAGESGAQATVNLELGNAVVGSSIVTVPAGGTTPVTFSGLTVGAPGSTTYTVRITNASPAETNVANNASSVVVTAAPNLTTVTFPVSLSYDFKRQKNWTEITYTSITNPSNTWKTLSRVETGDISSLTITPILAAISSVPTSGIDEIHWKIASGGGVFDEAIQTPTQTSTNNQTDIYTASKLDKNISVTLIVDKTAKTIGLTFTQTGNAGFLQELYQGVLLTRPPTGNPAAVLNCVNSTISFEFSLRSGSTEWVAATTATISDLRLLHSAIPTVSSTQEDPDNGVYYFSTDFSEAYEAIPISPLTGSARLQIAALESEKQSMGSLNPANFQLGQNYPNPFNPSTTFEFSLPVTAFVTLTVYDMLGREAATVASRDFSAGVHKISWNASSLPSGMYVYRMRAGDFVAQKKLMLVK